MITKLSDSTIMLRLWDLNVDSKVISKLIKTENNSMLVGYLHEDGDKDKND